MNHLNIIEMKKLIVFILMFLCVYVHAQQDTIFRLNSEKEKTTYIDMPDSAYNTEANKEQNFRAWLGERITLLTKIEFQYFWFYRSETINKEILNLDELAGKNIIEKESIILPQVFAWELIFVFLSSFVVLFLAQGACWNRKKFQSFWLLTIVLLLTVPEIMFLSSFGMESLNLKISYISIAIISIIIFLSFLPKNIKSPEKMRNRFILADIILFAILFIFVFSYSVPIFVANVLGIILGFPTIRFWRRTELCEITIKR